MKCKLNFTKKSPIRKDGGLTCRHCSIFPGSHPPSIFDTDELNFCVRNGNRWILIASNTDFLRTFPFSNTSFEVQTLN